MAGLSTLESMQMRYIKHLLILMLKAYKKGEELIDTFIEGGFTDVSQESKLLFVNPDNTVKDRIIDCLIRR